MFDVTMPGGRKLKDYPNLYESIKRIAYGVRSGPLAHVNSADVQVSIVNNLTTLAYWMISNGIEEFSQLTRGDVTEYAKLAVHGVHSILNSESLLERYLESRMDAAQFRRDDDEPTRREKAADVFPCLRRQPGSPISLDRIQVLAKAGLDHIGVNSRGSVLASLLDEADAFCGFWQVHAAKKRAYNGTSRDDYDDKPISEEHLRRFLMSFQYLWEHRRYIDDGMISNPFPHTSPRSDARLLGSEIGRTGTVPVTQATHLIERSVRWVLDYAPAIIDLKEWLDSSYENDEETAEIDYVRKLSSIKTWPTGPANPFPIFLSTRSAQAELDEVTYAQSLRGGMTLHAAILHLMTACSVVIAAFSARRAAEIIGIKAGCIFLDDAGSPWMTCFIHKTLMAESQIPIPGVVVSAVKVLERLSMRARENTGTQYIFQYTGRGMSQTYGLSSTGTPNFPIGNLLRRFGYFVDVPSLPDGTRWTFKPHQFRRFFAILYIWVYDRGDWGALQYHLRHFTHEMTRRYVSEDSIGQIIAVADREHTAEILANAETGLTQIGGIEGTRLKEVAQRIHAKMAQNVEVVSERKFKQRLIRYVERTGTTLKAFPWGYCAARNQDNMEVRNCSNVSKPDYDQASEVTCTGCAFNMLTPAHRPFLTQAMRFHEEIAYSTDAPEILRRASFVIHKNLSHSLAEILP